MRWRKYSARKLIKAGLCFAFAAPVFWVLLRAEPAWVAWLTLLVLLAGGSLLVWEALSDAFYQRLFPEGQYVVTFDATEIRCAKPSGEATVVTWAELEEIIIETTNTGPFVCDYFLHLLSPSASCTVPLGAQGYESLMQRLTELPGFDRAAAGAATPSTQNAVFRCWRRAAA